MGTSPRAVTALTCRLEELCWGHPLREADLCQAVPCQLWLRGELGGLRGHLGGLRGRLARPIGGLVAHQPFGPVRHRLKALQLPLPV